MSQIIRQIHSIGTDTFEQIVAGNQCAGMTARNLQIVGITDAGAGYAMERPRPTTGHLLVCMGGAGEAWVDGHWKPCAAGEAYVSPPLAPMGFRTVRKQRWQFVWVFLDVRNGEPSAVPGLESRIIAADPRRLRNAIEGLYLESTAGGSPERLDGWAELVNAYTRDLLSTAGGRDPLWQLWSEVDRALSEPWTLNRLAERVAMRPETLRRLCLRSSGMSPMRHVTHLRMRRAEAMLRFTSQKLFAIARQTGYSNTFAFSTAFRRWKGSSPKQCRGAE